VPDLRVIALIMLTVSKVAVDGNRDEDLGADSNIPRGLTPRRFVKIEKGLGFFWFEMAELPPEGEGGTRWKIPG